MRRQGLRIIARNWSCKLGELDLVAVDGTVIVFVEVRSTASTSTESPAESVDERKQRRLTNLALHYLTQHRMLNHPARFDVLVMSWPSGRSQPVIEYHRHAFEAVGRFQVYS